MKIIIMGCGRVGATLATMMSKDGNDVTIIDQNSDSFARLAPDFHGDTLVGDGLDQDVLERAGVRRASAFAAVTNGDNRNIMAAEIAQHIFGVPKVICRIYDPIRQETYNSLGLESVSPTIVGAQMLRDALAEPAIRTTSPTQSLAEGRSVPLSHRQPEQVGS